MTSRSPARISERPRLTQHSELRAKSASRGSVVQCAPSADHGRSSRIDPPPLVYVPGTCGLRFGEVAPSHVRAGSRSGRSACAGHPVGDAGGWDVCRGAHPRTGRSEVGLPTFVANLLGPGDPGHAGLPALHGWLHGATNLRGGGGQMRLPKNSRLWAKCGQEPGFRTCAIGSTYCLDLRFGLWSLGDSNP